MRAAVASYTKIIQNNPEPSRALGSSCSVRAVARRLQKTQDESERNKEAAKALRERNKEVPKKVPKVPKVKALIPSDNESNSGPPNVSESSGSSSGPSQNGNTNSFANKVPRIPKSSSLRASISEYEGLIARNQAVPPKIEPSRRGPSLEKFQDRILSKNGSPGLPKFKAYSVGKYLPSEQELYIAAPTTPADESEESKKTVVKPDAPVIILCTTRSHASRRSPRRGFNRLNSSFCISHVGHLDKRDSNWGARMIFGG